MPPVGCGGRFQSTLPMGGGTDSSGRAAKAAQISIHPPHGGRDSLADVSIYIKTISIHPPHGGRDRGQRLHRGRGRDFNPPSPWGEGLRHLLQGKKKRANFNPPSPWGEGPPQRYLYGALPGFQSTLPMGGGTVALNVGGALAGISIHPPHGGRDPRPWH